MKKQFSLLLLFLSALISVRLTGQSQLRPFKINGEITGIQKGRISILQDDGERVVCEAEVKNNRFQLHGETTVTKQMLFRCNPGNWNFKAFVEPGESTIFIDTTGAKRYGKSADDPNSWALIFHVTQCCTPLATDYQAFITETRQQAMAATIQAATVQMQMLTDTLKQRAYAAAIDSVQQQAHKIQSKWLDAFVETNPTRFSSPFFLLQRFQQTPHPDWHYFQQRFNSLSGAAVQSYYYDQLKNKLNALANQLSGMQAPDFTLKQPDGSLFTLSSLRGKYVLLDFWASWCGPCRKEIPGWKKVYAQYHHLGLEMVGISNDRYEKDWRKALAIEKMPWIQIKDSFPSMAKPAMVSDIFGIQVLPHYILINTNGQVLLSTSDAGVVKEKIQDVFGNLK
jgi:peroxiredoxin